MSPEERGMFIMHTLNSLFVAIMFFVAVYYDKSLAPSLLNWSLFILFNVANCAWLFWLASDNCQQKVSCLPPGDVLSDVLRFVPGQALLAQRTWETHSAFVFAMHCSRVLCRISMTKSAAECCCMHFRAVAPRRAYRFTHWEPVWRRGASTQHCREKLNEELAFNEGTDGRWEHSDGIRRRVKHMLRRITGFMNAKTTNNMMHGCKEMSV